MLILAAVLLVGALIAAFFVRSRGRRINRLSSTPTVACSEVAAYSGRLCEVMGVAEPGPRGMLTAPLSGQPCVWHRVEETEHYRDNDGNGQSQDRSRTLSDHASEAPFALRDPSGTVLIEPLEASVDSVEKTVEHTDSSDRPFNITFGSSFADRSRIVRKEWIIPAGQRLFVSGQAGSDSGHPCIKRSGGDELLITTKDEAALLSSVGLERTIALVLALVLGAGAIVTFALGVAV